MRTTRSFLINALLSLIMTFLVGTAGGFSDSIENLPGILTILSDTAGKMTLYNASIPCSLKDNGIASLHLPDGRFHDVKWINLSPTEMSNFFKMKGGSVLEQYLGASSVGSNFPNPISFRRDQGSDFNQLTQQISSLKDRLQAQMEGQQQHAKVKREAIPSEEYDETVDCEESGKPDSDDTNYIRLCTLCSVKRVLADNFYPRVMNEARCSNSDTGCLGNDNNGKCVTTTFVVKIMKRVDGQCALCQPDGGSVGAIEDWALVPMRVSVGCECLLDKNSQLRSLLFPQKTPVSGIPFG